MADDDRQLRRGRREGGGALLGECAVEGAGDVADADDAAVVDEPAVVVVVVAGDAAPAAAAAVVVDPAVFPPFHVWMNDMADPLSSPLGGARAASGGGARGGPRRLLRQLVRQRRRDQPGRSRTGSDGSWWGVLPHGRRRGGVPAVPDPGNDLQLHRQCVRRDSAPEHGPRRRRQRRVRESGSESSSTSSTCTSGSGPSI
jgi:hypothetical protein